MTFRAVELDKYDAFEIRLACRHRRAGFSVTCSPAMNVVSIWVPIAICVGVIASIAGVYWAWYRALHDEHGPAFIATAVTVVAFIGLLWTLNATVKAPTLPQSNTESWD